MEEPYGEAAVATAPSQGSDPSRPRAMAMRPQGRTASVGRACGLGMEPRKIPSFGVTDPTGTNMSGYQDILAVLRRRTAR